MRILAMHGSERFIWACCMAADGKKLGQVTEVVTAAGQRAVRAEMGTFLGLGPTPIRIPEEMLERKADRFEIIMTESEVKTFATRQRELKAERKA